MKYKRMKIAAILLLGLGLTGLQAQESLAASGGNASGTGGSVSYSVGQISYQMDMGGGWSMAQGVQQPYEISLETGIDDEKWINLKLLVFPNPATDYLVLRLDGEEFDSMSYQLFDMNGKLLSEALVEGNQNVINMDYLEPSSYILRVLRGTEEVKAFVIIKN